MDPQNETPPTPEAVTNDIPPQAPEAQPLEGGKAPFGPVVGIIIVVIILAIGGFYIWGAGLLDQEDADAPTAEEIASEEDPTTEELGRQSDSDEISSIEADLNASEFDSLDEDFQNIDAEFES